MNINVRLANAEPFCQIRDRKKPEEEWHIFELFKALQEAGWSHKTWHEGSAAPAPLPLSKKESVADKHKIFLGAS